MTIITDDQSVSGTTEWVHVEDGNAPFSTQVHVIKPAATTVDYTLQGVSQKDGPNDSAPDADDIITYSDMENETTTKVTNIISPVRWIRIVINSISGGTIKVKIVQAGRIQSTDNEIG